MAKKTNSSINGNEYFRIRVVIGKTEDGKDILKNFYGKSKKEAEQKKLEYLSDIDKGLDIDYKEMILIDLMRL